MLIQFKRWIHVYYLSPLNGIKMFCFSNLLSFWNICDTDFWNHILNMIWHVFSESDHIVSIAQCFSESLFGFFLYPCILASGYQFVLWRCRTSFSSVYQSVLTLIHSEHMHMYMRLSEGKKSRSLCFQLFLTSKFLILKKFHNLIIIAFWVIETDENEVKDTDNMSV